ncbi:MAG: hypothetical protein GXP24_14495 [Planctomycetes bacterium]|nr:hypothetical protein [Planctomycetota bacterium]
MKNFHVAFLSSLCLLSLSSFVYAEDRERADDVLLENLGSENRNSPAEKPASKSTTPPNQQFLKQQGEDLGERQAAKGDWLTKVVTPMQAAQACLEQPNDSGTASSAQAEALTGLDAMIAELTKRQSQCKGGQCKGGQCNKPGSCKPGEKPASSGKAGKSPAKSATSSTNSGADLSTDLAVAGELVKDLWGKLPERQREQILQPLREEFLPKYASEIEAYFRSLADPNRNPSESQ